MRALGVDREHRLQWIDFPDEGPLGPDQVRVKTGRVGVCATDREIVRSGAIFKLPPGEETLVLGHEASGVVIEVGDRVADLAVGDCVVPMPSPERNRGIDSHGYFRDYFVEERRHVAKVPLELRESALLVEPLTITHHALREALVLRRAREKANTGHDSSPTLADALVVGAGPIGLLGALMCRSLGFPTTVVDVVGAESPKARIAVAAGCVYVDASTIPAADLAGSFDLVLQTAPSPAALLDYLPALRHGGVLSLVGWRGGSAEVQIDLAALTRDAVHSERAIIATLGSREVDFQGAMERLLAIRRDLGDKFGSLVTATFAPEQFEDAFRHDPDHLVVALDFATGGLRA